MKTPKLSLIMPNYNDEDTLPRALGSIPFDKDMQVIIIDDGSTDKSWQVIRDWWDGHSREFHPSSTILRQQTNRGVAATMNSGFDLANGRYIISLSSDDYFVTDFTSFVPYLDGKNDLIYFDLEVNDGTVWHLDEKSKKDYVGAVKFIRAKFLDKTRIPDKKWHEDKPFSEELYAKKPREVFTGVVLKHYDWPREGSLSWQANHQDGKN